MSENLVEYTDEEKRIRAVIEFRQQCIIDARQVIEEWRIKCKHRHVNIEHKRIDSYDNGASFYSNMRCLVCDKRWTEEGSK